jgi:hypothetical protein
MKNLVIAILILLLILLALLVVISIKTHPDRIILPKKASFYTYTLVAAADHINYGCHMPDSVWLHYVTWKGDTIHYGTPNKCLLSENHNLINAVTGEVEYENVADFWEVKDETGSNPALSGL